MRNFKDYLLNYDSIEHTEEIVGKHNSEFNESDMLKALSLAYLNNNMKEKMLKDSNDTYSVMGWSEFKHLLIKKGFKVGIEYLFEDYNDNKIKEEAIIYYHIEKGLILFAESYRSKVNSGNLYGEVQANDNEEDIRTVSSNISNGGRVHGTERNYQTKQDVREGLFYRISKLESAGHFIPVWTETPISLWFVNYSQYRSVYELSSDDSISYYYEVSNNLIEQLPDEARRIMRR